MRASRQGMTLIEVLLAGGVMAMFLGLVSHAVVLAFNNQKSTSRTAAEFRRGVTGMEWLGRELRVCEKLYFPEPTTAGFFSGTSYRPERGVRPPFTFRRYDSRTNSTVVIAYDYDPTSKKVTRVEYDSGFDPNDPSTHTVVQSRVLAENAEGVEFTWLDPALNHGAQLVRIQLFLVDVRPNPMMEMRVKKL